VLATAVAVLGGSFVALVVTGLRLHAEPRSGWPDVGQHYSALFLVLGYAPVVLGAFAGGPVVARELEQHTAVFAWTQGVSRDRWYLGKVIRLAVLLAAGAVAVGLAFQWWIGPAAPGRLSATMLGLYAPVFTGWLLASFALAVALGAVLRSEGAAIVLAIITSLIGEAAAGILLAVVTGPGQALPPSYLWSVQRTEAGALLAVAALLVGAGLLVVRRSRA
jgi:hypothetical protein